MRSRLVRDTPKEIKAEYISPPYTVEVGKYLNYEGSMWIVDEITPEENSLFCWLKVFVRWSGIGPRPPWADEKYHTLYLNRQRKSPHYPNG